MLKGVTDRGAVVVEDGRLEEIAADDVVISTGLSLCVVIMVLCGRAPRTEQIVRE